MRMLGKRVGSPDLKRHLWLLGFVAPGTALLPSQVVLRTGSPVFWWSGPIIVFVVIPVLDWLVGEDGNNLRDEEYEELSNDRYYRWCTFLFLPVQLIGLLVACAMWSGHELTVVDKLGLAVTVGFVTFIGINAAHELGHRVEKLERWLSKIALAQSGYGHFTVEHNRGHHVWVATPRDHSSARYGESLWEFLPRYLVTGFRSAIKLEGARLRRKGLGWWSMHNQIVQSWAMTVLLFGGLLAVFGWGILPYLLLQAVLGMALLKTIGYIEHYGLLRERKPNGKWARFSPQDSWDCDWLVTNVFIFNVQRHSDHHINTGRRYQTLRCSDEAPRLPAGYITMVMCAMIPPLWRHVMDPRVLAHYGGDITKANIQPRKRAKILAAHGRNELDGEKLPGSQVLAPARIVDRISSKLSAGYGIVE
ncbi:alkane 1-monooxygenase [Nocardia altamirensis]|uniref:alkane 1-monooxygenase n=1 Tax=Nocardia altamirensis TaxID=472158 RepID=UPI000A05F6CC|nr:alkane 1-monooxygenase [Nocardia altamirensis]